MKNMNQRSKIYLIIFVGFLVVVIAASSYAYLTNSQGVGDLLEANTTTAKQSAFSAYHDGDLAFNISAAQMAQMAVSTNAVGTDTATFTAELTGTSDYETTLCSYDVVWVWDSNDIYTTSDVELPYTGESGTTYPYELSVYIDGIMKEEMDLSEFDWSDDGKRATIVRNQIIASASNENKVIQNYTVTMNMYNIEVAQKNLFDKSFKAHIEVVSNGCTTNELSENTVHAYTFNTSNNSYNEINEVLTPGAVDLYTASLSSTKTFCAKGGAYTESSGAPSGDECFVIYDVTYPEESLATVLSNKTTASVMASNNAWGIVNENGFRYQGDDPSNYICFGSEDTICPADNVYRIIGAFNDTGTYLPKVQKNSTYGNANYALHSTWSGTTINSYWPNTELYSVLNTTYYGTFASEYQNMIANVDWKLGAVQYSYESLVADDFYAQERGTTANTGAGYQAAFRIGLMYPSDYGYAALESDCARTVAVNAYNVTPNCFNLNWMHDAINHQWTISPHISSSHSVGFNVLADGRVYSAGVYNSYVIRPAFYLNPDVKVTGGTGTINDPYRISL